MWHDCLQISVHQILKLILWVFVRQNVRLSLLSASVMVLAVATSSLRLVNISPCSTQRSHDHVLTGTKKLPRRERIERATIFMVTKEIMGMSER